MSDTNVTSGVAAHPSVDVIIPTRNRWELTRDAIESVRAQTLPSWRLVVVDDASDDDSADLLTSLVATDQRMTLVRRPVRGGSNAARQTGVDASTAPLVATLDSDDLWRPTKLERQVPLAGDQRSEVAGLVVCWHDYVSVDKGRVGAVHRPTLDGGSNPLPTYNMSTLLVARAVLEAAGGFMPKGSVWIRTADHVDVFTRLMHHTEVAVVPELLVDCRHHHGARNSDAQGTEQAAAEAAELVTALEPGLDERPRDLAWLKAWVAARHLVIGDRRRGISYLRAACAAADRRTALRILRTYGPFTVKQLVGSAFGRGSR